MADSKTTPRLLTLHRAAEISGMSEQEILDLAALHEITAGVIVPFWDGYALPRKGRNLKIGVTNGKYLFNGDWLTTHYHVNSDNEPAHTVKVFVLSKFWELGGEIADLARHDSPKEISELYPHGEAAKSLTDFMPWDDSSVMLDPGQMITRQDLRFIQSEIEALSLGEPTPTTTPENPPADDWVTEAQEHYRELRREYPSLSKKQIAKKIAPRMKAKGRGGKPITAANILRNALQNIE